MPATQLALFERPSLPPGERMAAFAKPMHGRGVRITALPEAGNLEASGARLTNATPVLRRDRFSIQICERSANLLRTFPRTARTIRGTLCYSSSLT